MTPKRIQRQRTKGWRMPEGAIYVGRPTQWGNPFRLGTVGWVRFDGDGREILVTRRSAVNLFRSEAAARLRANPAWLEPLRGHDLVCWCPLKDEHGNRVPCHADVLLELANR